MSLLFRDAVFAAIGFSWPIVLRFAGPVSAFQVFVGTAFAGLLYFLGMVATGNMQIGAFSAWSSFVIFVCGVLGAFGYAKYLAILSSPVHVGIALALTQIIIVLGSSILHHGGLSSLGGYKLSGLIFTSIGIYLMNVK